MYVNGIYMYVYDILGNGEKLATIYRFLMKYLTEMMTIMYRFVVSCISISLVKSIRTSNKAFALCIYITFQIWINWKWTVLVKIQGKCFWVLFPVQHY